MRGEPPTATQRSPIIADAVKDRLISLEAAITILRLSTAIYPVGSWLLSTSPETSSEESADSWSLRTTLATWSWRAIDELRGDEDNRKSIVA